LLSTDARTLGFGLPQASVLRPLRPHRQMADDSDTEKGEQDASSMATSDIASKRRASVTNAEVLPQATKLRCEIAARFLNTDEAAHANAGGGGKLVTDSQFFLFGETKAFMDGLPGTLAAPRHPDAPHAHARAQPSPPRRPSCPCTRAALATLTPITPLTTFASLHTHLAATWHPRQPATPILQRRNTIAHLATRPPIRIPITPISPPRDIPATPSAISPPHPATLEPSVNHAHLATRSDPRSPTPIMPLCATF
jgi:hypothetical protein